jgi:hypothetical protein
VVPELQDDQLEDRPVAEGHERLREDDRERREARAAPAGEDDSLHVL